MGVKCEHRVKCEHGAKCKHEHEAKYECKHEAKVHSEIHKVGCILFISFLSVCTGDISTKAMVGVDVAA